MRAIPKLKRVGGSVDIPPSARMTAGAIFAATLAPGAVVIANGSESDDIRHLLEALRRLGWEVQGAPPGEILVSDRVSMTATECPLDVADSVRALRWLIPFLAFTPGRSILEGRAHELGGLVDGVRALDGEIEFLATEGEPPLQIRGKLVRGHRAVMEEALALAGLRLETEVRGDAWIASRWRKLASAVGGALSLTGMPVDEAGPEPQPGDPIDEAVGAAIDALATGGSIENEREIGRAVPRFWRAFDGVVAASQIE